MYESDQCSYIPRTVEGIKRLAGQARIPTRVVHLANCQYAQRVTLLPYGTFCVALDGEPVSYYPGDMRFVKQAIENREILYWKQAHHDA